MGLTYHPTYLVPFGHLRPLLSQWLLLTRHCEVLGTLLVCAVWFGWKADGRLNSKVQWNYYERKATDLMWSSVAQA